jgi:hypothetical protein
METAMSANTDRSGGDASPVGEPPCKPSTRRSVDADSSGVNTVVRAACMPGHGASFSQWKL